MTCQDTDLETIDIERATVITVSPKPTRPAIRNQFWANFAWMLIGNFVYGLSQWAQMVALAKVGSIEMVGSFALALAICLPVLMFTSLSLRALQVTDCTKSYRLLEYASLRLLTLLTSLLFIVVVELCLGRRGSLVMSTALITAAKAVEYISDVLYGSLQEKEDMSGIGMSMTFRAVLGVVALTGGVYYTHSLVWGAACLLLSSTLVLATYDIPKALRVAQTDVRRLRPAIKVFLRDLFLRNGHKRLWKLAITGLPMGFIMMLVSLNLNIPRYFIQQHLGTQELAIFSAIATMLTAGSVVTNAIGQAAAPRMARAFDNRDWRTFGMMLAALVAVSLGLGCLGFVGSVLFGKQAMTMLYKPEYSTRQEVLIWLMAGSGFLYLGSTLGYAVTAVRCLAPQVPLFITAVVATGVACFAFVPSQGLRGVAVAIAISAVVQCVGSAGLLWKACKNALRRPLTAV